MNLVVTEFVARGFDLDHMDLFWKIADFHSATDQINAYEFYIHRSESPEGPWEQLAGPFVDQYNFRDFSVCLLHKWRTLFYKLRVVHKPTSEEIWVDGAASLMAEPDLIALEITRQEDTLFRQYTGRRCWLFPVRTFGPKCSCYDSALGRRTRSNCLDCYDTGYVGGYLTPIETYMQVDPSADSPSNTSLKGESQDKNTSARLISYPPMKPKDILVEAENKRHIVVTAARTERLRATVHQEITLHQVPRGDVAYKLPINLQDLENQQWAEERNFTNPQHIDDQSGEGALDLLSIYDGRPKGTF